MAYKELKKTQQAEADFQQVIALTPGDADDWRGRGIALDGAIRCLGNHGNQSVHT
jgi:hypothetical protein